MQADTPLDDNDLERLGALLDAVPTPLEPLDVSALDGYLCGVLLQPRPVPATQWQAHVADIEGRPAPAGPALDELLALVRRRHAELDQAIGQRQWFDPWVFPLDGEATATECVLPWVAGFAAAQDRCPALMAIDEGTRAVTILDGKVPNAPRWTISRRWWRWTTPNWWNRWPCCTCTSTPPTWKMPTRWLR